MKKSMKNSLMGTALLLSVLLIAMLYFFFSYLPEEKKQENSGRQGLFPGLVKEDVIFISILYRSPPNIYQTDIEFISNRFMMIKPEVCEANQEAVRIVLNDLQGIYSENILTNTGKDVFKEYGLDNPAAKVKLKMSDSSIKELDIGSKTPVGNMSYATVSSTPGVVYLVYSYKFKNLEKSSDSFRGRDIFTIPVDDIDQVEVIKKDSKPIIFGKDMKEKILSLCTLFASSFYDGRVDREVLKRYGLTDPVFKVRIFAAGYKADRLYIGVRQNSGSWPGYLPDKNELVFINAPDLEKILSLRREN